MAVNEAAAPRKIRMNFSFKISKPTWLLLSAGILVIFIVGLLVVRNQQTAEQSNLNLQLTRVKSQLSTLKLDELTTQQDQLIKQNDQAVKDLASIKQQVAIAIDNIKADEQLYNIARQSGVTITNISASPDATAKLAGVSVSVIPITLTLEGDWPKLVEFITMLKTEFTMAKVETANITIITPPEPAKIPFNGDIPATPTDPAVVPIASTPPPTLSSANVNISVYTYKGN